MEGGCHSISSWDERSPRRNGRFLGGEKGRKGIGEGELLEREKWEKWEGKGADERSPSMEDEREKGGGGQRSLWTKGERGKGEGRKGGRGGRGERSPWTKGERGERGGGGERSPWT
ncbi:hypothetical protein AMTR_s02611p00009590 [Amborella trichopoda]|uniref:Uncharacterized protein n=1 Tax=Amborella trichopoda TaxID=13333 RepID=U5D1A1_AMBTC|nr:hypothetical protein AMTR_s02611p00009590 [Amborella trichopoda]